MAFAAFIDSETNIETVQRHLRSSWVEFTALPGEVGPEWRHGEMEAVTSWACGHPKMDAIFHERVGIKLRSNETCGYSRSCADHFGSYFYHSKMELYVPNIASTRCCKVPHEWIFLSRVTKFDTHCHSVSDHVPFFGRPVLYSRGPRSNCPASGRWRENGDGRGRPGVRRIQKLSQGDNLKPLFNHGKGAVTS